MSQKTSVQNGARSGKVNSDGYEIHFSVTGEGSPMLLVHGWGADASSNWETTGWVDTLLKLRQVISIDVRGHGRSDKPHALEPYSYAAMCQDVLAVMDALGVASRLSGLLNGGIHGCVPARSSSATLPVNGLGWHWR